MRWRRGNNEDGDDAVEQQHETEGDPGRPDVPVDLGTVAADELRAAGRRVVARALTEDLAGRSDLTSSLTVPVGTRGRAVLVARENGVVAGLELVKEVCSQVDHRIEVKLTHFDGDAVRRGTVVAEVAGPLRTLLTAERTFLNLVCHLSGIATRTRRFAAELEGTGCVVRDTRKTTPGLRLLEKHAVACGGGANHRIGLYDAVLVKDNHVAAAGGVAAAARAALDGAPAGVHVQVEVTSIAEAEAAIAEGVTDLLLDNFTPDELREAVAVIEGRAAVEASGGITLETARAFAEAGADRLAVGALTHSAPSMDLALDVVEVTPPQRRPVPSPVDLGTTTPASDPGIDEPVEMPEPAEDREASGPDEADAEREDTPTTDHAVAPDEAGDRGDDPGDEFDEPLFGPSADDASPDADEVGGADEAVDDGTPDDSAPDDEDD